MNKRTVNQNLILEGLSTPSMINEAAIPNEVLKAMGPKVKKYLLERMDFQKDGVIKVKNTKDEAYKNAYIRLYVMNDEWRVDHNGEGVVMSHNTAGSWRKTPKWEFFDLFKERFTDDTYFSSSTIKEKVRAIYVITRETIDSTYADGGYLVQNKRRDRREAQRVNNPKLASPEWYEENIWDDEEHRVVGTKVKDGMEKLHREAVIGQKTKSLKRDMVWDYISQSVKKSGFRYNDYRFPYDSSFLAKVQFNDGEGYLSVEVIVGLDKKLTFNTSVQEYNLKDKIIKNNNAEVILGRVEELSAALGDVIRFEKQLSKDKQLARLLEQI